MRMRPGLDGRDCRDGCPYALPLVVRSINWSVSQKHPQRATSILLTF